MPQTAAMRGLTNAFEPLQALRESASYLRELRTTFRGNLGLAAAAYNAGPGRGRGVACRPRRPAVRDAGLCPHRHRLRGGGLGGAAAAADRGVGRAAGPGDRGALHRARQVDDRADAPRPDLTANPAWGPWGVQLAGNWTEAGVLAGFERLRRKYSAVLGDRLPLVLDGRRRAGAPFLVRVSEENRQAAKRCARSSSPPAATAPSFATRATRAPHRLQWRRSGLRKPRKFKALQQGRHRHAQYLYAVLPRCGAAAR